MLARGAFAEAAGVKAVGALYLKLGGADGGEDAAPGFQGRRASRTSSKGIFPNCWRLLEQFAIAETPYLSRPFPKFAKQLRRLRPSGARQGMVGDGRPQRNTGAA